MVLLLAAPLRDTPALGEWVKLWSKPEAAWLDGVVTSKMNDGRKSLVQVTYCDGQKQAWIDPAAWGNLFLRTRQRSASAGCAGSVADCCSGGSRPSCRERTRSQACIQDKNCADDCSSDSVEDDPSHPYNSLRMRYQVPSSGAASRERGLAVQHLSRRRLVECADSDEEGGEEAARPRCPSGHVMRGKVAREMLGLVRPARAAECLRCGGRIDTKCDALYRCKHCKVNYCTSCAAELMEESREGVDEHPCDAIEEIMPGDILYVGPDQWQIHHTVLVRSRVKPCEDPDIVDLCDVGHGEELLECHTVETARSLSGEMTAWYPTVTYFARGGKFGSNAVLVADKPVDSETLNVLDVPVSVKVALHPLRGEKFDKHIFNEAVIWGCGTAKVYGKRQAVRSFLSQARRRGLPDVLTMKDYSTVESRAELKTSLHQSWEARPICASLCIKVWQMYFELLGRAANEPDEAVKEVLRWMPVFSDRTTPSALLKALTTRGWRVRQL